MWSRRRFVAGVGSGLAGLATTRWDGMERLLAAAHATADRGPELVAVDEDFWFEVQQAFTVDRNIVNLNNGTIQPSLRPVQDAMRRHYEFSANAGAYTTNYFSKEVESVRRRLAAHAGCDGEELVIARSGSEAGEIAVMGIDLKPGDEVVTTDQDYPRLINAWKQREAREHIVLKQVDLPPPPVALDDFYRKLESTITPRTRVVMICHMTHRTAQVAPMKRIIDLAHQRGIQVIVDGAHGFMHVPVNVRELDCDYYVASLHKWLMAPPGNGFLYVKKSRIESLWPLTPADLSRKANIRKFEDVGTRSHANRAAIAEAITFNEGIGLERKSARLRYLTRRWADRLKAHPRVRILTDLDLPEACGIAAFTIEGMNLTDLTRTLLNDYGIVVSHMTHPKFDGLRIVTNVSMTVAEIDYFAGTIESVLRANAI
ncbi:MAG: aminotransferase class V-fold PLP-dependent enzyme [Acidobacteriota bacterium]